MATSGNNVLKLAVWTFLLLLCTDQCHGKYEAGLVRTASKTIFDGLEFLNICHAEHHHDYSGSYSSVDCGVRVPLLGHINGGVDFGPSYGRSGYAPRVDLEVNTGVASVGIKGQWSDRGISGEVRGSIGFITELEGSLGRSPDGSWVWRTAAGLRLLNLAEAKVAFAGDFNWHARLGLEAHADLGLVDLSLDVKIDQDRVVSGNVNGGVRLGEYVVVRGSADTNGHASVGIGGQLRYRGKSVGCYVSIDENGDLHITESAHYVHRATGRISK